MKHYILLLMAAMLGLSLAACTNSTSVTAPPPNSQVSNPITKDTVSGNIRGTMLAGKTYYIKDSITVLRGDTLDVKSGVTIYMLKNPTIFVQGTMITEGTQSAPIYLTVLPSLQNGPSAKGSWGGIQCDSLNLLSLHWTHIDYTGGPDVQGSPRQAVRFNASADNSSVLDVEDCWVSYGSDDVLKVYGGSGKILRNTIEGCGTTDGDGINIKTGWVGDVAYNLVWQSSGSCVKIETAPTVTGRLTKVNVYNNTLVVAGFRRLQEAGFGTLVDANADANVWNNVYVNNRYGFQEGADADTVNVHYGNNLFFGTIDSLNKVVDFFPPGDYAHAVSTDKISVDPQFVNFDSSPAGIVAARDLNDYHLKSSSPALGAGNTNFMNTGKGDKDMGAYTSTSTTNLH